jgi:hypothetical protein
MAKNTGVAAVVTDGMARDRDGIVAVGLPVFARGITPNSCVRSGPGRLGFAIVCGGVAVEPGDIVLGDRDGVVVIPQRQLEAVVAALADIRVMEEATQKKIRAGMTHLDSVADLLQSDRVAYVDKRPTAVIPGFMPRIQFSSCSGVRGWLDPGDERRDDHAAGGGSPRAHRSALQRKRVPNARGVNIPRGPRSCRAPVLGSRPARRYRSRRARR